MSQYKSNGKEGVGGGVENESIQKLHPIHSSAEKKSPNKDTWWDNRRQLLKRSLLSFPTILMQPSMPSQTTERQQNYIFL